MDEDFFGFRELGLAEELGLTNLSVPFHLLQNRMHSSYQAQNQGPTNNSGMVFPQPDPYEAVSMDILGAQIGLVQDFFRGKLRGSHDDALVEDEDLPQKQRFPKPRLPPTGKISSPRKRPIKEQQQAAKKKRKLEEEKGVMSGPPVGKLKLDVPKTNGVVKEPGKNSEKEKGGEDVMMVNGDAGGEDGGRSMISPESLTAS